jgi:hypothetical protein
MQPRKTDLARTALQAHRAPLDMRQRRLLILCDGQRTVADLTGLLGQDAPAMVIQLVQAGYLSTGRGAHRHRRPPHRGRRCATPPPAASAAAPAPTPPLAGGSAHLRAGHPGNAAPSAGGGAVPRPAAARAEDEVLQRLQSAMQMLPGLTRMAIASACASACWKRCRWSIATRSPKP